MRFPVRATKKRKHPATPEETQAAATRLGRVLRAKPKKPALPKRHPIRNARARAQSPTPTSEAGMCLRETRECFDVASGAPDAIAAWNAAQHKHPCRPDAEIPGAVPVFWSGGSEGHGHVGISADKHGLCWSMDILRPGYWDRVPIALIHEKWGLTFLGWTEDLNGVTVYEPKGVKK